MTLLLFDTISCLLFCSQKSCRCICTTGRRLFTFSCIIQLWLCVIDKKNIFAKCKKLFQMRLLRQSSQSKKVKDKHFKNNCVYIIQK